MSSNYKIWDKTLTNIYIERAFQTALHIDDNQPIKEQLTSILRSKVDAMHRLMSPEVKSTDKTTKIKAIKESLSLAATFLALTEINIDQNPDDLLEFLSERNCQNKADFFKYLAMKTEENNTTFQDIIENEEADTHNAQELLYNSTFLALCMKAIVSIQKSHPEDLMLMATAPSHK